MYRKLGSSEIKVSSMGLGCWTIGGPLWHNSRPAGWSGVDDKESIRAIHCGLDCGITYFDTADVYGAGHSEYLLARALKNRRQDVVIATKFGFVFDEKLKQILGSSASRDYIYQACEASLKRLNTDYIDLYQFHLNGYDLNKSIEVRSTLEDLVTKGKIRYFGWSTDFPKRARLFAQSKHCIAVQFRMNVLDDAPEMTKLCESLNLACINRAPLAMGLLSGKYALGSEIKGNDVRSAQGPDWMKYFENGQTSRDWYKKFDSIREILTSNGRTLVQGALAWLWGRSHTTIPIPGFRSVSQVLENCAAMKLGPLTKNQMAEISIILSGI
jgi:aryl-alcohol dehydrogenase-like predicted oxidoreductase